MLEYDGEGSRIVRMDGTFEVPAIPVGTWELIVARPGTTGNYDVLHREPIEESPSDDEELLIQLGD